MKWFKHFTDNHRGRSIQALFDEMGHAGLSSWYVLMEICAEKLEKIPDKPLEDSSCLFNFHERVVRQNLRLSPRNLRKFLEICRRFSLLSYEFSENFLKINMPILLDLLEYDQKKFRPRRASVAPVARSETEKETQPEPQKQPHAYSQPQLTNVLKNVSSPSVKKSTERGCIDLFLDDPICVQYFTPCSVASQKSWVAAYGEIDFIKNECRKAHAWISSNPKKAPKNFQMFFANWLSRGFESYRKGIPSRRQTNSELNIQVLRELHEKNQKGEL